jgi:hypothetical protein
MVFRPPQAQIREGEIRERNGSGAPATGSHGAMPPRTA